MRKSRNEETAGHPAGHGQCLIANLLALTQLAVEVKSHLFIYSEFVQYSCKSFNFCVLLRFGHRFFMAFRPTDYQSHGKKKQTVFSFFSYLTLNFKVCSGSLPRCRSQPRLIFSSFFTDSNCDASRVCRYLIESILPSAGEMLPIPLAATKAQSTTYTPL